MYNSKTVSLSHCCRPPYKYNEPTYTVHLTAMPHKFITITLFSVIFSIAPCNEAVPYAFCIVLLQSHHLTLVTCTDVTVASSCKIHIVYNCLYSNHLHTTTHKRISSRVISLSFVSSKCT